MNIPDINDHLTCYNYEHKKKPVIEALSLTKGSRMSFKSIYNKIVFIAGEEIIFLPVGKEFQYKAFHNSNLIIFRLLTPISLCEGYSPEMLYKDVIVHLGTLMNEENKNECKPGRIGILPPVAHFFESISIGIASGMKCRCWFDLKINELFMLLRVYYPKQELYGFLYPAISGDNEFSEYVLKYWREHPSVKKLSASMYMTTRQLSARFMAVFATTPGQWIIAQKAQIIHHDIICTTKPFSLIASENGFNTESVFTHFCKRVFDKTPSELRKNKK